MRWNVKNVRKFKLSYCNFNYTYNNSNMCICCYENINGLLKMLEEIIWIILFIIFYFCKPDFIKEMECKK